MHRLFPDRPDFKKLIAGNKALEVNTSGLRQELGKTMPSYPIIKRFREFGGKFVTLGSDAHRWADVAGGVEHGMELLERAGFFSFYGFCGTGAAPNADPIRLFTKRPFEKGEFGLLKRFTTY